MVTCINGHNYSDEDSLDRFGGCSDCGGDIIPPKPKEYLVMVRFRVKRYNPWETKLITDKLKEAQDRAAWYSREMSASVAIQEREKIINE